MALAVVLAGGQSRRMGSVDKRLLLHPNGEPVVRRVVAGLQALARVRVVCPWSRRPDLAPLLAGCSFEWIDDPGEGPGEALARALEGRAPGEKTVVVPADLVRPSPQLTARLLHALEGSVTGARIQGPGRVQLPFSLTHSATCRHRSLAAYLRGRKVWIIPRHHLTGAERAGLVDVDRPSGVRRYGLVPGFPCAFGPAAR